MSVQELIALSRQAGLQEARWVHCAELPPALRAHPQVEPLGEGGFLMAALSCYRREPADLSTPGDPHSQIAPFARRDYYRDAVARLKTVVGAVSERTGIDRRRARIFCNSRLPEKPLAAAAGLGFMGKNRLMIVQGLGSLFVIAGVFLPLDACGGEGRHGAEGMSGAQSALRAPDAKGTEDASPWVPGIPGVGTGCGACRACLEACPVGALSEAGGVDGARCLQALAGRAEVFGEATCTAWGVRLYGCQSCQDVCPYNRSLRVEGPTTKGELGPRLSIRRLLRLEPAELKALLRWTPMGMSWIDPRALLRNALVAAGNAGDAAILPEVARCGQHADGLLRAAARWSIGRLQPAADARREGGGQLP